jgi:ATP-binding protein involved in chromosome partitioning
MEDNMSDNVIIQTRTVPVNFGPIRDASGNARIKGPCGDTMEFWILAEDNKILVATFTTDGCQHSILCGSVAGLLATGITIDEASKIDQKDILNIIKDLPEESHHCALLASNTLKSAINNYLVQQKNTQNCCEAHDKKCNVSSNECKKKIYPNNDNVIKNRIAVLSGKGGVGKSTVAVNLAYSLASSGRQVGLLDVDIHGPSIPKMSGLQCEKIKIENHRMIPVEIGNLKVMSIGFMINAENDPLIWRGPMKTTIIRQFIEDVKWGELDFLIVDCPPGTGDEPLSVIQVLGKVDGAVIVTTPQDVAVLDVKKSVNFCRKLNIPISGIIENMSGFICPKCSETYDIFKSGGGRELAEEMSLPFLGSIPIDPNATISGDEGKPFIKIFPDTLASKAVMDIFSNICSKFDKDFLKGENNMKIAIPTSNGVLCMHFGHCDEFAIIETDNGKINDIRMVQPPPHEPGLLPRWLGEMEVELVIAGGMGMRAQKLFSDAGVEVLTGAPAQKPEQVVTDYLNGTLVTGKNTCDH